VRATVGICPNCAGIEEGPIVCERCGWRWYANPKPAAGTLVERGDDATGEPAVLLLRRAVEPGFGAWDLPAGYLDPGESPEQAALRETREESGLQVRLERLVGVYTARPGNAVSAIFLARPIREADSVTLDAESSEHAWVTRSAVTDWLPRMAFSSMAAALSDWAAGRQGAPQVHEAVE
jgi:ADP-ribose pyrophosphatase YjhB (NUDIX family)